MRKLSIRIILLAGLAVLLPPVLVYGEPVRPLIMWRAEHGDAEILMIGSIHVLSEDFYPLPPVMTDAVDRADVLVLEVDPRDGEGNLEALIEWYGRYRDGTVLSDHLEPKLFDRVEQWFLDRKTPAGVMDAIRGTRPWLVAVTMQMTSLLELDYVYELGMETVVLKMFTGDDIHGLEEAEFQLELLAGLPEKDQISMLDAALSDTEDLRRDIDSIVGAWTSGDLDAIADLMDSSGEARVLNRRMITDRNIGMTDRIIGLTEDADGVFLVLVGAAHFAGPEGIPALMAQRGIPVSRVLSDGTLAEETP